MDKIKPDGTNRLQIESQRMEERLRMLKQLMSVEKAQRDSSSNGGGECRWQSGKRGPLSIKKANSTSNKTDIKKAVKVKILTGKESDDTSSSSVLKCGQCDQYKASMMCVECVENYCNICFVKFHHKGSLSKHHVRPLGKGTVKECQPTTKRESNNRYSSLPLNGMSEEKEEKEGHSSLLTGHYDEAASAAMFQEALKEWRNPSINNTTQSKQDNITNTITSKSCGVQADQSTNNQPTTTTATTDIEFSNNNNSLSYFEKLLLKKVKTNPSLLINSRKPLIKEKREEKERIIIEEDEERKDQSAISPYNIFYNVSCITDTAPPPNEVNHYIIPTTSSNIPLTDTSEVIIEELPSSLSIQEVSPSTSNDGIRIQIRQSILPQQNEKKELIVLSSKKETKSKKIRTSAKRPKSGKYTPDPLTSISEHSNLLNANSLDSLNSNATDLSEREGPTKEACNSPLCDSVLYTSLHENNIVPCFTSNITSQSAGYSTSTTTPITSTTTPNTSHATPITSTTTPNTSHATPITSTTTPNTSTTTLNTSTTTLNTSHTTPNTSTTTPNTSTTTPNTNHATPNTSTTTPITSHATPNTSLANTSHVTPPHTTSSPVNITYNVQHETSESNRSNQAFSGSFKGPFSLSASALSTSIKHHWENSTQSYTNHDLSPLLMTSVTSNITNNDTVTLTNSPTNDSTSLSGPLVTKGCIWLPTNSIPIQEESNVMSQLDLPPPTSVITSQTYSHNDDDLSDSDSDQTMIWEEKEEREESEEDEELVRALTSSCLLELGKEEEREEEEEGSRVWSRMTIEELIHDFDTYQDQIRHQDDTFEEDPN